MTIITCNREFIDQNGNKHLCQANPMHGSRHWAKSPRGGRIYAIPRSMRHRVRLSEGSALSYARGF